MNSEVETIASEALGAFDTGSQIEPFTTRFPDLDIAQAYEAAAAIRRMRKARGEKPAGRKIGFTNRNVWPQFGVSAPMWGDMYEHSVRPIDPAQAFALARMREPLIEPEIAFGLSRVPTAGMNERELLDCIGWIAHGFELVQSIYPGWTIKIPDAIAGLGMHGAYRLGAPHAVTAQNRDALFESLTSFTVTLSRDGTAVDTGRGSNVLDGPLSALRHLVALLSNDPHNPPLAEGEIVTTGTLTRAFPVKPGETWSTDISGIPLAGLSIRFG